MPSAYAYFRVSAPDLPLAEITTMLGVEPTESWIRGDPGKYNPSRPDSGWCLHSPLPRSETNLSTHIEALLPLLRERQTSVKGLSERFKTFLVCVGMYDGSTSPGLFLSRESVALLASLGVAVDADLYFENPSLAP
jgi:hypothetical protein